jgi:hypothetical protein
LDRETGAMNAIAAGGPSDSTLHIAGGRVKRIHVNQHVIRANAKAGTHAPPISVKTSGENFRCHAVEIDGPSTLVYSPRKPLACGARLWIETHAPLALRRSTVS